LLFEAAAPYLRMALSKMALSGFAPGATEGGASANANAVTSNNTQLTIRARKPFGIPLNAPRGTTFRRPADISGTRAADIP
jgi:hypothetical protein